MTKLVFNHNWHALPTASLSLIPVQIYGIDGASRGDIATIGSPKPLTDQIKRLGVKVQTAEFDFLTLALAVTAADTFVDRKFSANGWAREFDIHIPLANKMVWEPHIREFEKALHFLSGDIWHFTLLNGGMQPFEPYDGKGRRKMIDIEGLDSVCLFSGGLDSTIGAIDLLDRNVSPLLVSHAYNGDREHQNKLSTKLSQKVSNFQLNAVPKRSRFMIDNKVNTDITMRTRSLNFLAFATVGAAVIAKRNKLNKVPLYVPENGFISLNAPLASRRLGTLSTKTTHPYFLGKIQNIFDGVGINVEIKNPYQFKTKGEMIAECTDKDKLADMVSDTVSCSHWKRNRKLKEKKQCGTCVPCLIRRASLLKGQLTESSSYKQVDLVQHATFGKNKDDLFAVMEAVTRSKVKTTNIGAWLADSGPLGNDEKLRVLYKQVFLNGLNELDKLLKYEGLIA